MQWVGSDLAGQLIIAGAVLFAPGALVLLLLERWFPREVIAAKCAWAGVALALSLTISPLLWAITTLWNFAWSPATLSGIYLALNALGAALAIGKAISRWQRQIHTKRDLVHQLHEPTLVVIVLLATGLRFLVISGVAYPAWVDSPHHDLIVKLLSSTGVLPGDYRSLLPVTTFTYHFGFHASAVPFLWLTGLASPDAIVIFGQLLNGLLPIGVYGFARLATHRPWPAIAAAAVVGLVSLFPGYYVSWGRYTQLTGLAILGPLLGLLTIAFERYSIPSQTRSDGYWTGVIVLGMLIAGLFFAHYRVLAFALTYGLALQIVNRRLAWRAWLPSAVIALLLTSPWLLRLSDAWVTPNLVDPSAYLAPTGYNDFPWHYFNSPLERAWWGVAALGAVIGLIRRERAILVILVWVALTSTLLNIPGAGSWVVNNNSWAISAFLPGSVVAGYALEQIGRLGLWLWRAAPQGPARLGRARRPAGALVGLVLGTVVTAGLGFGIQAQTRILNPRTILALPADRQAMAWVRANLPTDAMIVVNSWYWQHDIWSASDGGIWIWTETGRRTTTPPVDYYFDPVWTREINDWNARWAEIKDYDSAEALALLGEVGATHVYLGAVPGRMTPAALAEAPELYRPIYSQDGVSIYQITP